MRSIFWKIFGSFLLTIFILSSLILAYSFNTIRSYYYDFSVEDLKNMNFIVRERIYPFFDKGDFQGLDSLIKYLGNNINKRITIIDASGIVLADSRKDPAKLENHLFRPEIQEALKMDMGHSRRFSATIREEMLYVAIPIKMNNKVIGISRVSIFLRDIDALINALSVKILGISILVVVLSLIAALAFLRSITKPLKKLVSASRKVAEGDFLVKVELKNKDEIGNLAESFNYMINEIRNLFAQISSQKEELNSIIAAIREGFVVIDTSGNILLANDKFKEIAESPDVVGSYYWDVLSEDEFESLFNKIREKRGSFSEEIQLKDTFLLCSGGYLESKKEIIIILHDITHLKKLDVIKKNIVSNVSHELRTPLTAIIGFIETLEDEIDDDHRYYLSIIKRHTNRLINIVQDLNLLSELEEKNTKLIFSRINLRDVCDTILKIYENKIHDKNLRLAFTIEDHFPEFEADLFKLEQMLINLIDNAIKYTAPDNGDSKATETGFIRINIFRSANFAVIEVSDNGIGIPKEDIERIFERFYTVDKSRSRKLGGSGLGLSIVKHIVKLHNGEITVESSPNQGTTFTVKLPINP
ncbi:MAG: two-component system, OmpR family, phosphate regulon sensor histidine kinase PhoR [Bacteroidota bacterium]|nr:two-component system, OmpR family, phosphate regulon sensor histidine kinase PhoR [Bacteroidota bacterium]